MRPASPVLMPERQAQISDFLFEHGQTSVHQLADKVGISLATLRRDLVEMEQNGQVQRLHGAARLASSASAEVAFSQRENTNLPAKRAIAISAQRRIRPGSVIFLDAGTTVLQLARRIRMSPMPLTVFTNGLVVAQELISVPGVEVNLLGGRVRVENMSVAGAVAEGFLEKLWFDQLFLGASALDANFSVSSFDADEARLNATMINRAAQVWVLADRSKFEQRATYAVCDLQPHHNLITDLSSPVKTGDADQMKLPSIFTTRELEQKSVSRGSNASKQDHQIG